MLDHFTDLLNQIQGLRREVGECQKKIALLEKTHTVRPPESVHQRYFNEFESLRQNLLDTPVDDIHDIATEALNFIQSRSVQSVLDLGCGSGDFYRILTEKFPEVTYLGIDIYEDDMMKGNPHFKLYNGFDIPCLTGSQKFIFSKQVLEHIRDPYGFCRDVARVLADDGIFFGSCSGLEPQHGDSIFNFTPCGLKFVFEHTGLELITIRHGIPVDTLLQYYLHLFTGKEKPFTHWGNTSSTMLELYDTLAENNHGIQWINYTKLVFSGHIYFIAKKRV